MPWCTIHQVLVQKKRKKKRKKRKPKTQNVQNVELMTTFSLSSTQHSGELMTT